MILGLRLKTSVSFNFYAPNIRADHEAFLEAPWVEHAVQLRYPAGSIKCVYIPQLDRLGPRTASCPKRPALGSLLEGTALSDARLLREHAANDEELKASQYTYWIEETSSWYEIFYIPHP